MPPFYVFSLEPMTVFALSSWTLGVFVCVCVCVFLVWICMCMTFHESNMSRHTIAMIKSWILFECRLIPLQKATTTKCRARFKGISPVKQQQRKKIHSQLISWWLPNDLWIFWKYQENIKLFANYLSITKYQWNLVRHFISVSQCTFVYLSLSLFPYSNRVYTNRYNNYATVWLFLGRHSVEEREIHWHDWISMNVRTTTK